MIQENILLAPYTWFRVGGPAQWWCEPRTIDECVYACAYAQKHQLSVFVLGEGANVLVSDEGLRGLVIRPCLSDLVVHDIDEHKRTSLVTAGAGVSFAALIQFCLDNNLGGLEEFSGIPGTVGGSVYINIHYFEFLLSQFLVSAQVIDRQTGKVISVNNEWFAFGYNTSRLQDGQYFLLTATFKLMMIHERDQAFACGRRYEIIRYRTQRYPSQGTCGSFFRNFFPEEVTLEIAGKKMIHVAYYLDKLGLKGVLRVGDAMISYQHANMLVNCGNATARDIITLARIMQERVFDVYGIVPQPECIIMGFEPHVLL
jgi:UDP-N-acetylmuramate dehydrogenase